VSKTSHSARVLERVRVGVLGVVLMAAAGFASPGAVVKGEVRVPGPGSVAAERVGQTVVGIRPAGGGPVPVVQPAHARVEIGHGGFSPAVVAVPRGSVVEFVNRDEHLHNLVSASPARKFDLGLTGPGESGRVTFDAPGIVRVRCKAEAPMEGWVVVMDTPWFAVVDERAGYTIGGLPVGAYTVTAWNPNYEPVVRRVTVAREGEVLTLDLSFQRERPYPGP
jgi:plastocyanin